MSEATKTTKKNSSIITFLGVIDGWMTRGKNLHWGAPADDAHRRADELIDVLTDIKDSFAEDYMGLTGTQLTPDDVENKPCLAENLDDFITEVKSTTYSFYENLPSSTAYVGIKSECEAFIHNINKYSYLIKALCKTK